MVHSFGVCIAEIVILIAAQQGNAARFLIAEKGKSIVGALLQIAEAYDIAAYLDGIENAVCAGISLNQPVHFQILVHPQGIQRRRIKAGQEHVDHNQQVKFPILHPQGNILVVILELIAVRGIIGVEHLVIVADGSIQKVTGTLIQRRGILRILLVKNAVCFFLVCAITVNDGYFEPLLWIRCHLALKLGVIQLGSVHAGHGENGVESAYTLLLLDFLDLLPSIRGSNLGNVLQDAKRVGLVAAIRFLVEVRQNIFRNQANAFRRKKSLFAIDVPDFLVVNVLTHIHRLVIFHAEGQHILVTDSVNDGVGVKLVAERLRCCAKRGILAHAGIDREDGRAGKAEQMIPLEVLGDGLVHVAELTAMALIEDDDEPLVKHCMSGILLDERGELLNGGDDDFCVVVLKLTLQDCRGGIAVCRALLKAVVLLHRLVVQILAVNDEQHLVDVVQLGGQLRRFEGCQRLAAAGGVPDISAARDGAVLLVVVGDFDAVQNALGGNNLVGTHDQQHIFRREHAIAN